MRSKSPSDSYSIASKKIKLRDSKSSDITAPLVHNRSKLLLKCVNSVQNNYGKPSVHSEYNHFPVVNNYSTNMSINTQKTQVNMKSKPGDYYFGASTNSY